jgi:hypothetical protein
MYKLLNDNIFQQGNISKDPSIANFFLFLTYGNGNLDPMEYVKMVISNVNKKNTMSVSDLYNIFLTNSGRHAMLSPI